MPTIKIEVDDLKRLLIQQKQMVIDKLLSHTYVYNTESTDGHSKSMENINVEKFKEHGHSANFPYDFEVIKKYIV